MKKQVMAAWQRMRRLWAVMTLRGRIVTGGIAVLVLACFVAFGILLSRVLDNEEVSTTPEATAHVEIRLAQTPQPTRDPALPAPTPTPDIGFSKGAENEIVQVIQERLMELGYLELDESTQKYGSQTEAAVRLFQRQVNFTDSMGEQLDEDGICGAMTLQYLFSDDAPHYVVKFGMEGEDITNMQLQLKDLGYISATTGYFGEKTVTAMKEFQGRNGLSQDGLAGERSFELLYSPNARESKSKAQTARTKASVSKMIEVAKSKLGCKYILGNTGPKTFDCSGLVYYCLREAGSNRRRLNAAGYSQVSDWTKITSMSKLKKGDLIFFYNNAKTKVGHVGIVVHSGEMIDASSANGKVVRRSYTTSYWKNHFVCGRRPW
ncbi:MAG: peptidoglycan-binding protein [Clostridia bacterium]|nr:peptidoglycan-binding protein [Clostridia bacterium]